MKAASESRIEEGLEEAVHREGKYLILSLEGEEYGIGILRVREIIGMTRITPIPQTPDCVRGVINLRGQVIPVVDLRLRFGMHGAKYTERTCIIVVEVAAQDGFLPVGIVVDSVREVVHVKSADIEEVPKCGISLNTDYILGMARMGDGVKILLDIDRVLTGEELALVEDAA